MTKRGKAPRPRRRARRARSEEDAARRAAREPEGTDVPAAADATPVPRAGAEPDFDGPSDDWDELPRPREDEVEGDDEEAEDVDDGGY
jgi:hypothetical protein